MKKNPEFYFQKADYYGSGCCWFRFSLFGEGYAWITIPIASIHFNFARFNFPHNRNAWSASTGEQWRKVRMIPSRKYGILRLQKLSQSSPRLAVYVWRRYKDSQHFKWHWDRSICTDYSNKIRQAGMRLNTPYYLEFID